MSLRGVFRSRLQNGRPLIRHFGMGWSDRSIQVNGGLLEVRGKEGGPLLLEWPLCSLTVAHNAHSSISSCLVVGLKVKLIAEDNVELTILFGSDVEMEIWIQTLSWTSPTDTAPEVLQSMAFLRNMVKERVDSTTCALSRYIWPDSPVASINFEVNAHRSNTAAIPSLRVLILVVGTRGDLDPFCEIGVALKRDAHRVRLATHAIYRDIVESHGLEFFPLAGDPHELSEFMVRAGNFINPSGPLLTNLTSFQELMSQIINSCWDAAISPHSLGANSDMPEFIPDAIISNPVTYAHVHVAEALGIPLHLAFPQPWVPTKAFPHPLSCLPHKKWSFENFLSYQLVDRLSWIGLESVINEFRVGRLGLEPLGVGCGAWDLLNSRKVPYSCMWSPALVPKPKDYGAHCDIVGCCAISSAPPPPQEGTQIAELQAFLDAGKPPVFLGFGSMVVNLDVLETVLQLFLEASAVSGTRLLVQHGWSGVTKERFSELAKHAHLSAARLHVAESSACSPFCSFSAARGFDEEPRDDSMFDLPPPQQWNPEHDALMIGACAHSWLFERMSAVVHHGGAGTTMQGIKANKPTWILPMFGDQFFYGHFVGAVHGLGPLPCPVPQLTISHIIEGFEVLRTKRVQDKVSALRAKLSEEDGARGVVEAFYRHLPLDDQLCQISILLGVSRLAEVHCVECGLNMTIEAFNCLHVGELALHELVPCAHVKWLTGPTTTSEVIYQGMGGLVREVVGGLADCIYRPCLGGFTGGIPGATRGGLAGVKSLVLGPIKGAAVLSNKVRAGMRRSSESSANIQLPGTPHNSARGGRSGLRLSNAEKCESKKAGGLGEEDCEWERIHLPAWPPIHSDSVSGVDSARMRANIWPKDLDNQLTARMRGALAAALSIRDLIADINSAVVLQLPPAQVFQPSRLALNVLLRVLPQSNRGESADMMDSTDNRAIASSPSVSLAHASLLSEALAGGRASVSFVDLAVLLIAGTHP